MTTPIIIIAGFLRFDAFAPWLSQQPPLVRSSLERLASAPRRASGPALDSSGAAPRQVLA